MKIAAVILAHNAIENGRRQLLYDTITSLGLEADLCYAVDNGSTDDTPTVLQGYWFDGVYRNDVITTCGHGTNLQMRVGVASGADIVVCSDDDMFWRPGWAEKLRSWWNVARQHGVLLTGCHLEPVFAWNGIIGDAVTFGGVRGLVRRSTGAASWSFLTKDWTAKHLAGLAESLPFDRQGWYDVPFCDGVRNRDGKVCQIDLADHAGHGMSTWGNTTVDQFGWDLAPVYERLAS